MSEISRERRAEVQQQLAADNVPAGRWIGMPVDEVRTLLDYADERDEAEGALHWLAEQLGLPDDGPAENVGEAVAAVHLAQKQRDEMLTMLQEGLRFVSDARLVSTEWGTRDQWIGVASHLLRRVGGSHE